VWDRVRHRVWGLSGRLIATYVLVTLAVVVLVEALVLGYQVPRLENDTRLQSQVAATASVYLQQLSQRYPPGTTPRGTLLGYPSWLGRRSQPGQAGQARLAGDGATLVIPGIAGPIRDHQAVTAAVLIAPDGRIIASSAPARYPPGQPSAHKLPAAAVAAITSRAQRPGIGGSGSAPYGRVIWALAGPTSSAKAGFVAYLYVQAPLSSGYVNPIRAWNQLRQLSDTGPLLTASYALLIAIVPVGMLFGLLATRRIVRRVHRLEQATVAVADGDYTVTLPTSRRDEIGRLEANFTTMTRQLGSALAAERERASSDAAAAERTRLAREIHDAISQHLFGLRMIATGMRRAIPDNEQVQAIERITEDALRDMQALLLELRPPGLDGAGLAPALQQMCAAYHDRLGMTVDTDLDDVTVPAPVEHALLRITQEACTNAIRHGNARSLAVSITRRNRHVELAVRDTGTGFDPAAPHNGSGLAHIRDRVAELGGTMHIHSAPGQGAALTVRVPIP
jgi:signal transduction histidine kinase